MKKYLTSRTIEIIEFGSHSRIEMQHVFGQDGWVPVLTIDIAGNPVCLEFSADQIMVLNDPEEIQKIIQKRLEEFKNETVGLPFSWEEIRVGDEVRLIGRNSLLQNSVSQLVVSIHTFHEQ